MKTTTRLLISCGILLCALLLAAFAGQEQQALSAIRTEVSVQSVSAGAYLLSARLTDLDSGKVLAAPSVKVPANEEASAESTLPGGSVSFTGKVDPALHSATYTVRLTRGGQIVSEHSASVAVQ